MAYSILNNQFSMHCIPLEEWEDDGSDYTGENVQFEEMIAEEPYESTVPYCGEKNKQRTPLRVRSEWLEAHLLLLVLELLSYCSESVIVNVGADHPEADESREGKLL